MLPLKDENPTRRMPLVTVLLIGVYLWLFFSWQPVFTGSEPVLVETGEGTVQMPQELAFSLQNAAIPCEIVEGRPLTVDEAFRTFEDPRSQGEACGEGSPDSSALFPGKSVWLALVTSMFLHGDLLHLGGNLLFLWIFGNNIEDHLGHFRYLLFYLLGGVVASAAHIGLNLDSTIPVVGASGAIAAVMGAYLVWFPDAPVRTAVFFFFITLVDIRAKWLLIFWFVSQFFTAPDSGVAWAAHVGGFVFGVVAGLLVRSNRRARQVAWAPDYRGARAWDPTGGVGYHPYQPRRMGRRSR